MLKQLIQRLLDSRTTPAQAAHNASSTYTEPTWFNGTPTVGDSWTDNLYTGTAPSDGYLNVSGSANINTANAGSMIQAKISGAQISQVTPMSGQGFNMMAPISKGATFSVNGIRLADITVRFFKSIGGGYNCTIWRALSCLKALSNFSQRNSFLAEVIGFLISPTLRRRPFISRQFKQANGLQSFRRVTDGFVSKPLLQTFFLAMANCGRAYIKIRRISRASHCLSQRAGQLLTNYQQTQRAPLSSLFQVSVIGVSALTGGTSC